MTDVTELLAGWRKLADSVDGWAYSDSREDEAFSRDAREPFARLLDAVQAVLDPHRPDVVDALAAECCECGCCCGRDGCPTRSFTVCRGCLELAEEADPNITEEGGISAFAWPCPTVRAINDALTTGDTND